MLQFHNSSYLFSLLPLWVQAGPALPGQYVPGLTDMKGSTASSQGGATGCPTDPWLFPPFGGHNPGCPHRGDRGRGVYQQALMVSSFSHMQITTSRQKRPRGRQKKGEVVGDNAGWDCWKNCCGQTIPSSSGGILAWPLPLELGGGSFCILRAAEQLGMNKLGQVHICTLHF